jgi:hypothetical protein
MARGVHMVGGPHLADITATRRGSVLFFSFQLASSAGGMRSGSVDTLIILLAL